LETWYDWLGFVPRHRLGQIVPMIGDRRFGSIVQKFLHEYGEISIFQMETVAPYEEDPNGSRPRVRAFQNRSPLRFEMAEAQMPANIKNFNIFELRFVTHFCYTNYLTWELETHKWDPYILDTLTFVAPMRLLLIFIIELN
jgi:hypothetical protein